MRSFTCSILVLLCYISVSSSETFRATGLNAKLYQNLKWDRLIGGFNGCEGAQWLDTETKEPKLLFAAHHDHLVFSWQASKGLSLFKSGSPEATSFRPDANGALYVVEQGNRRLAKWNQDGETLAVLASHYQGKKLNRPNDARLDGMQRIWFTDPDFLFRQRPHEVKEQKGQYVYCYDLKENKLSAPIKNLQLPNGIAIDPQSKDLYVGDSRQSKIFRYPLKANGELGEQELFYQPKYRRMDGLAFDTKGHLWFAGKESITALSSDAKELVTIELPNQPTSMDFHKSGWVCVTLRDSAYVTKMP